VIRTFCTCCDAEIEVPAAGRNKCPACGLDTVCFSPPEATFTLLELKAAQIEAMKFCFPRAWRRGFLFGVALGAACAAASSYWARLL